MSTRTVHFVSPSSDHANNDNREVVMGKRGCCFWIPFMSSPSPSPLPLSSSPSSGPSIGGIESTWWERILAADKLPEGPWWMRGWHRFREWSELVAGPRWKNFIRRFSKSRMMMQKGGSQFRYDPLSYAMNFDEGAEQNGDSLARDFSSRYASIPASCKSSMDLGHSGPLFA